MMRLGVAPMLCAVTALGSSCSDGPFEVQLSIVLSSSISSATAGAIKKYVLQTTGDESFSDTFALSPNAQRREVLTYHPKTGSTSITISVTAEDASGNVLATGDAAVHLTAGQRTSATITLEGFTPDLGSEDLLDSSGVDATGEVTPLAVIDFEGDAQDKSGSLQAYNAGCQIETTASAHGGTHDGYCTGSGHYQLPMSFFDQSTTTVAFRGYLRYDQTPSGTDINVLGFFDNDSFDYVEIGINYAGVWAASYDNASGGATLGSSLKGFADSNWHCVEAVMTHPSELTFYVDSVQVGTKAATDVEYPAVFPDLNLGIFKQADMVDGGVPDVGVHMDDIVVSTQRIGCSN